MRGGITTWTSDQVEELKRLWAGGDSASVIAGQMGFTRNAILGKVHRLELEPRGARNGAFYGVEVRVRVAPKRPSRQSVFRAPERKPALRILDIDRPPPLVAVMSPITGAYMNSKRVRPHQPEYTKEQLRAQLTQAVLNTARMA